MKSPRLFPMFYIFLVSYLAIHLHFEYGFWLSGTTVFDKYATANSALNELAIAERVYYAKASWCFALIILQAAGLRFYPALALSFLLYGLELMLMFPFRVYTALNLLLALGMVIEVFLRRRELNMPVR